MPGELSGGLLGNGLRMRLHPGEVEAIGWRVERLTDVMQRLRDASPDVGGRPRVFAVDGRGGAGKTTLVKRLRQLVASSATVHNDDIAWNQASFDWAGHPGRRAAVHAA